jgi:hypothetical protein
MGLGIIISHSIFFTFSGLIARANATLPFKKQTAGDIAKKGSHSLTLVPLI